MNAGIERPDFSVFVWLRRTERFAAVRAEVLDAARAEPFQSTEYQSIVYLHWRAGSLSDATCLAGALEVAARHPELILLQIMSRVYGEESISIIDRRRGGQRVLADDYVEGRPSA